MAPTVRNFRSVNAIRLLGSAPSHPGTAFIGSDTIIYLAASDWLLPSLLEACRHLRSCPVARSRSPCAAWGQAIGHSFHRHDPRVEWATRMSKHAPAPKTTRRYECMAAVNAEIEHSTRRKS